MATSKKTSKKVEATNRLEAVLPSTNGNGKAKKPPSKKAEKMTGIVIPKPRRLEAHIDIVGITPLVTHAWDAKAREMILAKQMGKVVKQEFKDPEACYEASMYRGPRGEHGVPAGAFKDAMVQACRFVPDLTMTFAKQLFFVRFNFISTEGMRCVLIDGKPHMREDMVRINNGRTADVRFRAEYTEWAARLRISFDADILSLEHLMNLCARAGMNVGVCEMRPSSPESNTGDLGLWQVQGL
jgi:hypothetical protein